MVYGNDFVESQLDSEQSQKPQDCLIHFGVSSMCPEYTV